MVKALYNEHDSIPQDAVGGGDSLVEQAADVEQTVRLARSHAPGRATNNTETAAIVANEPSLHLDSTGRDEIQPSTDTVDAGNSKPENAVLPSTSLEANDVGAPNESKATLDPEKREHLNAAIKQLKSAYDTAKRRWRIPSRRIERVQAALSQYTGTRNFHNYTVHQSYFDKSSQRHIKSFTANPSPILINGTEWLSLKVHGQSFMMHQIRKMVGMAALLVRCGAPASRVAESYANEKWSIPKVPGLGLLLERPVFDSYNTLQAAKHDREKLDFGKFEKEMEEFKRVHIYEKIFEDEARENT